MANSNGPEQLKGENPFAGDSDRQSFRAFLGRLYDNGDVYHVPRTVSTRFEISAFLSLLSDGPAVYFADVENHTIPVVGNVLSTQANIALGLNASIGSIQTKLREAIDHRIDPIAVENAPVQDMLVEHPDLATLPFPYFFEHETGPYITAGTIVARDPETGARNFSIARLKPLGGNRAFIGIAPNHHLAILARKAQSLGEKLPIAVSLGNHPALTIASAFYLALGDDELGVAGTLLGEPVQLAACVTIPLEAPAHSEIVLEGTIDPEEVVDEGRVSEFHGLYEDYKSGPVVTFNALTHRLDPILQVIQPGYSTEHLAIGAVAIGATVANYVKQSVSALSAVEITLGGSGRLHAVVALHAPKPGDARKAMFATWASTNLIKQVTVVDSDINVGDPVHVEWAMATRMKADRDILIVPAVRADRAEPLEADGTIPKLGIDACINKADRIDFRLAQAPPDILRAVKDELGEMQTNDRLAFE